MSARACSDCGVPVDARNKHGRCRSCTLAHFATNPEAKAKRVSAMVAAMQSDDWRQKQRAGCMRAVAKRANDPTSLAVLRANGAKTGPINVRKTRTPEAIARAVDTRRARAIAWCPEEHREFNEQLERKGFKLAERKQIIADEVKRLARKAIADEQARLARMTPFERQQDALARGATLITKPVLRKADHAFTLGGVASGELG